MVEINRDSKMPVCRSGEVKGVGRKPVAWTFAERVHSQFVIAICSPASAWSTRVAAATRPFFYLLSKIHLGRTTIQGSTTVKFIQRRDKVNAALPIISLRPPTEKVAPRQAVSVHPERATADWPARHEALLLLRSESYRLASSLNSRKKELFGPAGDCQRLR